MLVEDKLCCCWELFVLDESGTMVWVGEPDLAEEVRGVILPFYAPLVSNCKESS